MSRKPKPVLPGPVGKGFRPGDVRRVEAYFLEMVPEGYGVEVKLSQNRKAMQVVVMDPEDPKIYVANCQFSFDEKPLKQANTPPMQPPEGEVMRIAAEFGQICEAYPQVKAKQEAEQLFKADFADRKEQFLADEEAQRERDKLLLRADREEEAAMAQDGESR